MLPSPILLQGAMAEEISSYLLRLGNPDPVFRQGYPFYEGRVGDRSVIVSLTGMGMIDAAAATLAGIAAYSPTAVINQGTAGAHIETLRPGDIVIGRESVDIHALEMPSRPAGQGSDPFAWEFLARSVPFAASPRLLSLFSDAIYPSGEKLVGVLGSGDLFSKEVDRIRWLHEKKGTFCEDMESSAVYRVCSRAETPCVGVRIISNNELTGLPFDIRTAALLQDFIWSVLFPPP